ncbi:spore coat protein CotJB [Thermincola potens]|uniref:Protein CotJB domain-containing protein n=1 Tax=Thermincola potens (strain JR) TaxID=635013 RepID=D5XAM7_THEPJ|nr:spore coat protein CotJB [Thermincola potens]ADG83231.1 conserved hypothetical protein [Thermincola potens JR]
MHRYDKRRVQMLEEIMMVEFATIELGLFLDTHPYDMRALKDYNRYTCMLQKLKAEYEQLYGPLALHGTAPTQFPWKWVEEPWPWEIEY